MNNTAITSQIKDLKAQAKELEDQKIRRAEADKIINTLYKDSGYNDPVILIKDLMAKFDINYMQVKPESNRKPAKRVTPEFRDSVKSDLSNGASKRSLSIKHNISYIVIQNIEKGKYDTLADTKPVEKITPAKPASKSKSRK